MHRLVNISAHGFSHLAQTAPVIKALQTRLPNPRLTICSALLRRQLKRDPRCHFAHVFKARDFGFTIHNSGDIDLVESARAYRDFHQNWRQRIGIEAAWIRASPAMAVLTNVAHVPLAAAASAGIPSDSLSLINRGDLFVHCLGSESAAAKI
jgi:hypothetical protein